MDDNCQNFMETCMDDLMMQYVFLFIKKFTKVSSESNIPKSAVVQCLRESTSKSKIYPESIFNFRIFFTCFTFLCSNPSYKMLIPLRDTLLGGISQSCTPAHLVINSLREAVAELPISRSKFQLPIQLAHPG